MKYVLLSVLIGSLTFAHNYHGCALAPDNLNGWVVCLDTALILHTTDGGQTWQSQNPPNTDYRYFMDVTCVDSLHAWTAGKHYFLSGEICGTTDGGNTWAVQDASVEKYAIRIEFIDTNYGWSLSSDGTVDRTTDGGAWWQRESYGSNEELYGVSFVNTMDGWIVAGWPDNMVIGQGLVARSTDGGHLWQELYRAPGYEDLLDIYFFNLLDGIVVGGDDQTFEPIIMKTSDGGNNWDTITCPPNTYYLRAVDFVDNEGWAVGKHGTIIYTSDYGTTWAFQDNPAESTLFDVDFSDNLHGLACGYDTIFYTTDGGQTWLVTGIVETGSNNPEARYSLQVYPNPGRGNVKIRCMMQDARSKNEESSLKIYDCAGRLVKSFNLASNLLPLASLISWDGTDDSGQRVPEGIYFVHLETEEVVITEKAIFLR